MSRFRGFIVGLAAIAAVSAGAPYAIAQEWPSEPIRLVVGSGAGGSFDRVARAMAPYLSEKLGQPVVVENRPGAATHVGHVYFLQQPDDGHTIMVTAPNVMTTNIIAGVAKYTLDDFAFINTQWTDWDLVFASSSSGYKSAVDFVNDAKARPGQVSVAVISKSSGELTLHLLLEAFGLDAKAVRMVTYDDGNELRTAMAGGHMDLAITAGDSTEAIKELITPLAVVRRERHPDWDLPTLNEALADLNANVPVIDGTMRSFAMHKSFPTAHPERWEKLVSTFEQILTDEKVKAALNGQQIGADWIGPERATELAKENAELLQKYQGFFN